jgi:flagellar hook-basal body complex protein FliE
MAIPPIALGAYKTAINQAKAIEGQVAKGLTKTQTASKDTFGAVIKDSLKDVNDLYEKKLTMVEDFASGKSQNVHELMITLQKAGLAMNITSTVRNKVLDAYKELIRMPM